MTAKTRYFFVGAALILVLGLGIGTVAYYAGVPGGLFAAGPGPDELRYVPEDAAIVAFADVQDVMRSELRQRLNKLEQGSEEKGRQEFQKETGIDIERDIDHVVVYAGAPAAEERGGEPYGLMLARGRYDQARIEALAKQHGGVAESYKGHTILALPGKPHRSDDGAAAEPAADRPGRAMAMAFAEPGLLVLGPVALVRQAIDRGGKGPGIVSNPEFRSRIAEVGSGSVWAVGRFDTLASRAKLPEDVSGRIPAISWFSVTGQINGGLRATVRADAKDEAAANNLRDIVRGFTALAKMSMGNKPEAAAAFPELELGGTGATVTLSFAVTSEQLDVLTKLGQSQREMKKVEKTN